MTTQFLEVSTGQQQVAIVNGEARKQGRLSLLRQRRAVYVRRGQRALLAQLLDRDEATADDVRRAVELPPRIDAKLFGSVPGPLARAGIIVADGFTKTSRPAAHARPITVWRLVDRGKAEQWLAENPDLPDLMFGDELPLFAATNEKRPTGATAGLRTDDPQRNPNGGTSNG